MTQLLEPDLSGEADGRLALIVTCNPDPQFYDETTHVMEFSAIARQIRVVRRVDSGLRTGIQHVIRCLSNYYMILCSTQCKEETVDTKW